MVAVVKGFSKKLEGRSFLGNEGTDEKPNLAAMEFGSDSCFDFISNSSSNSIINILQIKWPLNITMRTRSANRYTAYPIANHRRPKRRPNRRRKRQRRDPQLKPGRSLERNSHDRKNHDLRIIGAIW
ncbi:hypothetical protein LXL04_019178 [Taraxacum kok-saghyz]